ncbi:MAG: hypothetical protein IT580_03375, partial [Verrucomicrobiales bacterium]|nr:hypothetical protein [Verrucomicrobiales bacterium]
MNTLRPLITATALATALASTSVSSRAATVTVLEGFEHGLDQVALAPGGARPSLDPAGVTLSE